MPVGVKQTNWLKQFRVILYVYDIDAFGRTMIFSVFCCYRQRAPRAPPLDELVWPRIKIAASPTAGGRTPERLC